MTQEELRNKYRQEDIVFGTKWFLKHQSKLLFLLNNSITKRWFRYCLRIRQFDIPLFTDIIEIAPNRFSWGTSELRTTDFRTHDKFSKRLYFAFKPFWYLLHFFDWVMLDRVEIATQYSFGFTTLTQYPGTTSADNPVDGTVGRAGQNVAYGTLRAGAGTTSDYTSSSGKAIITKCSTTSNQYDELGRSIFCYDTSSIDDTATISAVDMFFWKISSIVNLGIHDPVFTILSTPAATNALANADFSQIKDYGTDTNTYMWGDGTEATDGQYNSCSTTTAAWLSGFSEINKTGITKFGMRTLNDWYYPYNNSLIQAYTWNSGKENSLTIYFANQSGTTNDPKLVVTYTVVTAPTVTTQAATNITKNSFTANGNITATGGANATRRGFCYKVGTSGDPTVADSVAYDDGDFGTGAFTKGVTSLTPSTGYRVAAYATNSAGTAYGSTVQVTTLADTNASFLMFFM